MKRLIALAFFSITFSLFSQEKDSTLSINWMTLTQAQELQKKNPKKIFMDAYTSWCGPCKMLDQSTFNDPELIKYVNEKYYAVKFNAEGKEVVKYKGTEYKNPQWQDRSGRNSQHELTQFFSINSYPSMIFFDEQANPIFPLMGYYPVNDLEIYLKLFGNDDYKTITTQEAFDKYIKEFKHEF